MLVATSGGRGVSAGCDGDDDNQPNRAVVDGVLLAVVAVAVAVAVVVGDSGMGFGWGMTPEPSRHRLACVFRRAASTSS